MAHAPSRRARRALPLSLFPLALALAACDPPTAATPADGPPSTPPVAASSSGAAPPAPVAPLGTAPVPATPASFSVRVHLPGADPQRHLTASVRDGVADGCVSNVSGACDKTRHVAFAPEARAELDALWRELSATPRCEPEGIWPGDRAFSLEWPGGGRAGHLPAKIADLAQRNVGPCRAEARIATWLARAFGALEPAADGAPSTPAPASPSAAPVAPAASADASADRRFALVVSFISIGQGTDRSAKDVLDALVAAQEKRTGTPLARVDAHWGKEGELDVCMTLGELSARERAGFVLRVRGALGTNKLVRIGEDSTCHAPR